MHRTASAVAVCLSLAGAHSIHAQTLRGSGSSVDRQHSVALQHDYTFLAGTSDVNRFVELGLLVPVRGDANYALHAVSFPYARPAVRTFVERLAAQYRSACGEQLVVTSLTRPTTRQPGNASSQSVHPAGMAVDLRRSNRTSCRRWLENTLLSLEKTGVLEATRERNPVHYHVAVFPTQYLTYVGRIADSTPTRLASDTRSAAPESAAPEATEPATTAPDDATTSAQPESPDGSTPGDQPANVEETATVANEPVTYRVRRGDSLWSISRANDMSISELKSLNGLRGNAINAGITLTIAAAPADEPAASTAEPADDTPSTATYRVRRGDSLWSIARAHSTTVEHIRELNGFSGNAIKAGQIVTVPTGR